MDRLRWWGRGGTEVELGNLANKPDDLREFLSQIGEARGGGRVLINVGFVALEDAVSVVEDPEHVPDRGVENREYGWVSRRPKRRKGLSAVEHLRECENYLLLRVRKIRTL